MLIKMNVRYDTEAKLLIGQNFSSLLNSKCYALFKLVLAYKQMDLTVCS